MLTTITISLIEWYTKKLKFFFQNWRKCHFVTLNLWVFAKSFNHVFNSVYVLLKVEDRKKFVEGSLYMLFLIVLIFFLSSQKHSTILT